MKFPYRVRHDGIDYLPGEDVPIGEVKKEEPINKPVEISFEYTKSQVNRLSTAELQALASKYGIESDKTGAEIKKILITKFDL